MQVDFDKNTLNNRLEELGVTLYQIAKRYSEILGEDSPATRYHSAISKAFENSENSKLKTVETIVQALGGKIVIEWDDNFPTEALQQWRENQKSEKRLQDLEKDMKIIKELLRRLTSM